MPDQQLKTLAEALRDLFPRASVAIVPTSAPVAAIGVSISFSEDSTTMYVPALNAWWTWQEEPPALEETSLSLLVSVESVRALIAFQRAMWLIGHELVVGHEREQTGDDFAEVVEYLIEVADISERDPEAASSASLYLAMLNANLAEAQEKAESASK